MGTRFKTPRWMSLTSFQQTKEGADAMPAPLFLAVQGVLNLFAWFEAEAF